ncbi:hypothetical protein GBAR_LOCUS17019 [Geodia barretti]|nr:hypothetical protein GBAR_LOCUS17019 [Geodia barretti]
MKIAVLLLTLMAAAWASPVSFSKTSDGWSKVTSRSLAQQMLESMEESYGMPGTSNAERYDALESDDEDEWVRGPGDDDNDDDHDDDKDNSGDGKRDQEIREG